MSEAYNNQDEFIGPEVVFIDEHENWWADDEELPSQDLPMYIRSDLAYPEACPICQGDCGSANPPVMHCPMDRK